MSNDMARPLYLQLWSLRRETEGDPAAVIRQLPEMGFGGIETAGDYGWSNQQWADLLEELGLRVAGIHTSLDDMEQRPDEILAWAQAIHCHRLVISSLGEEHRTKEGYQKAIARMNKIGAPLRQDNFRLYYHNHAFEFELLPEGGCGMDILLHGAEPGVVKFEADVYWVEKGGLDSLDFVLSNAERIGMLHAKEIIRQTGEETIVGEGDIHFSRLCQEALKHDWPVIVEYEEDQALAAVTAAAKYLRPFLRLE